jgi:Phycobilisome degradation protein nblA
MEQNPAELTLEQKFSIRSFETQVENMSPEQSKTMLMELYQTLMVRENVYKHLIKQSWSIGV